MPAAASKKACVFKHGKRVAWRKVADEAVILDVEKAVYFSLSGPGLRMWELLGEGTTPERIAAALAQEYDAAPERIREDLDDIIARLRKERLLEPA